MKLLAPKSASIVLAIAILSVGPASAAGWSVLKNEADPFEPSKSTYVAITTNGMRELAIRCLEGTVSLLLISGPSNASAGDSSELKIVADSLPVREEENAQVIDSTTLATSIQFGDGATLEYLNGANSKGVGKISIRYTVAGVTSTDSFSGGRPLANVITAALKACGDEQSASPATPAIQADQSPAARTCRTEFAAKKAGGDLGPNPDEEGYVAWCKSNLH